MENQDTINKFLESLRIQYNKLPISLDLLANYGWYIIDEYFDFKDINKLGLLIKNEDVDQVDLLLEKAIEHSIQSIELKLTSKYPQRAEVLKRAFSRHANNDYWSSIPLFLIQAEGICEKELHIKLYSTEKGKPKIGKLIKSSQIDDLESVLLNSLLSQKLITSNEDERNRFKGSINRHEILHGKSTDYGNKTNSCKAISWLNFIDVSIDSLKNNQA